MINRNKSQENPIRNIFIWIVGIYFLDNRSSNSLFSLINWTLLDEKSVSFVITYILSKLGTFLIHPSIHIPIISLSLLWYGMTTSILFSVNFLPSARYMIEFLSNQDYIQFMIDQCNIAITLDTRLIWQISQYSQCCLGVVQILILIVPDDLLQIHRP